MLRRKIQHKLLTLPKPKRRWAQFSLGTMLLAVTALCIWLADYVHPVSRLARKLRDPDKVEREIAAKRLGYLGPEARSATKSLLRAMDDESKGVRETAVWALSRVSGRPDLVLPFLADSDKDVKLAAAEGALWAGGDPVQIFSTLLADGWLDQTSNKYWLFERLGPNEAAAVVPLLLDSLGDDNASRHPEAYYLKYLAVPALTVVPALIERLDHDRSEVRKAAAEQLLLLGAAARQAAPAVRARLHDRDP
jgi:HEAT repeat protein